jgi:hypothetical protein
MLGISFVIAQWHTPDSGCLFKELASASADDDEPYVDTDAQSWHSVLPKASAEGCDCFHSRTENLATT